jgi:hypothetical protein
MKCNADLFVNAQGKLCLIEHSIYNYNNIELYEVIGVQDNQLWVLIKLSIF